MLETARALLDRGDSLVIFPEGTRIRPGALGRPKRGVGRMALETGVPIVPIALIGTEAIRKGWRIRPHKVSIRAGNALVFPHVDESVAGARRRGDQPHLAARRAAVGVARRTAADAQRRGDRIGRVGHRRRRAARQIRHGGRARHAAPPTRPSAIDDERRNERYLPEVDLPPELSVKAAATIELSGQDLIVFAIPSKELPNAVAQAADRIGQRSAVLVLSKGLVPPLGTLPSEYVGARVRTRAIACLGGPAHAAEAVLQRRLGRARHSGRRAASPARRHAREGRAGSRTLARPRRNRTRRLRQERRRARRQRRRPLPA